MIERKLLHTKLRDYQINEVLANSLSRVGFSSSKLKKTPLGEKISIVASRPGLVVGRKGSNIKALTKTLKTKFKLENPQIEIEEVVNQNLDAQIVAEKIQSAMERFGTKKFKGIGHKAMDDIMSSGALGVEILVSGKVPSQRAKRWRFYKGYLKKSGDVAVSKVATAYAAANLKSGSVGIQVRIMLPDTWLPDRVDVLEKEDLVADVQKTEADDNSEAEETLVIEDEGEESHDDAPEEEKGDDKDDSTKAEKDEAKEETPLPKEVDRESESKDSKKEVEQQQDKDAEK